MLLFPFTMFKIATVLIFNTALIPDIDVCVFAVPLSLSPARRPTLIEVPFQTCQRRILKPLQPRRLLIAQRDTGLGKLLIIKANVKKRALNRVCQNVVIATRRTRWLQSVHSAFQSRPE